MRQVLIASIILLCVFWIYSIISATTITVSASGTEFGILSDQECNVTIIPDAHSKIVFNFTIRNTGSMNDSYSLTVKNPSSWWRYHSWHIGIEDADGMVEKSLTAPQDIILEAPTNLSLNETILVRVHVTPYRYASVGLYDEITVTIASQQDHHVWKEISFGVNVIRPNVRIDSDPENFSMVKPAKVRIGDSVTISARVFNDGPIDVGPFDVWFYSSPESSPRWEEGDPIAVVTVSALQSNTSILLTVPWEDIPYGFHQVHVHADKPISSGPRMTIIESAFNSHGSMIEASESDNVATVNDAFFIDLLPNIEVTELAIRNPYHGKSCTLSVVIRNIGRAPAGPSTITLHIDIEGPGKYMAIYPETGRYLYHNSRSMEPGEEETVEFYWHVLDHTVYTLTAEVYHPDDPTPEMNSMTKIMMVENPPKDDDQVTIDDPLDEAINNGPIPFWALCGPFVIIAILIVMMHVKKEKMIQSSSGGNRGSRTLDTSRPREARKTGSQSPHHGSPGRSYLFPGSRPREARPARNPNRPAPGYKTRFSQQPVEDWSCSTCGSTWPATRTLCFDCGKKRS